MEYRDRVVIKRSLKTQFIYIIILLFVGCIFGVLFFINFDLNYFVTTVIKVISGGLVLFFGSSALYILINLTKPLLVIDAVGFHNNGAKYGMISWCNVRYVYYSKSKSERSKSTKHIGASNIGVELINGDEFLNSLSKSKRKFENQSLSILIPVITIDATFAKREVEDIVAIMNKYLTDYKSSNEGYSGYEAKNKVVENFDKIILERHNGRIIIGFCLTMVAIFLSIMIGMIIEGVISGSIMVLPFILIFGSLAIKESIKNKNKTPVLIIDQDGFTDYESKAGLILWRELENIDVVTRKSTSRNSDGRSTTTYTTTIDIKIKNNDKLILLTLGGSKETHGDVADVMRRYSNEYIKNNPSQKTEY